MNFANPHFAEPAWLWLAFLGPLALFALQRLSSRLRRKQLAQIAAPHFLGELTRSHSRLRRIIKEILLLLAVTVIGLAMARPQWGERTETSRMLGQDTVFVLDCSRSMLAADIAPNRLYRAKLAILDYVHRYGRGRVGLVVFAGQPFLQCPLTFDYGAFRESIMAADDKVIPIPGTDIARALDEAYRACDRKRNPKLVILVTDGEDLEKGGVKMAQRLAKEGMVVYALGVGTPGGAEITMYNQQGRPELVRDRNGEVVRSRLDETTLREIAQATRGQYFPLGPAGEGFARVQLAFEALNTSSGWAPGRKLGVDRFHAPVALALLCLVVEPLIGTRRRVRERKQS